MIRTKLYLSDKGIYFCSVITRLEQTLHKVEFAARRDRKLITTYKKTMNVLEHKIPPPIVTLLFALTMWRVSLIFPLIDMNYYFRIIASALTFFTGLFFCVAGVASFRLAKTTVNPLKPDTASSLVSSGVYRVSRNPMYVGFALFLTSFAVYLSSPLSIIGVIGFVLYINRFQIKPEEEALSAVFGAEFSAYMQRVRRWL